MVLRVRSFRFEQLGCRGSFEVRMALPAMVSQFMRPSRRCGLRVIPTAHAFTLKSCWFARSGSSHFRRIRLQLLCTEGGKARLCRRLSKKQLKRATVLLHDSTRERYAERVLRCFQGQMDGSLPSRSVEPKKQKKQTRTWFYSFRVEQGRKTIKSIL